MSLFTTVHIRGEATILYGPEVLYRTRIPSRTADILPSLSRAWNRGFLERLRGWPDVRPNRSPIFELLAPRDFSPGWEVVERHPKASFGDRILYRTESEVDAHLCIAALRRAATLGALSV